MAVAGVIETRAYFRKRGAENAESPQPWKRQRLQTSTPEDDTRQSYTPAPNVTPQDPSPPPAPAPLSGVISTAAREALSVPWAGPADFRYGDDDDFEDSNDVNGETVHPVPIVGPAELGNSDTDSETDMDSDDDGGSSRSSMGEVPDTFDTNTDLNAAEYSERAVFHHNCRD